MPLFDLLTTHAASLFAGTGLGLSLIVAIGAQNAYVLRQGARREHLLAVLLVCIASDVILILGGVAGLGTLITHAPWVITVMRWFGVAFLLGYGLLAARRAWRPSGAALTPERLPDAGPAAPDRLEPGAAAPSSSQHEQLSASSTATLVSLKPPARRLVPVLLTVLAITWLNPHVYLDTVFLLGSVANTHGPDGRWAFAVGACLGSIAWFIALGSGARMLSRWLASPLAWRILDGIIAAIMLTLAVTLALSS